MKTIKQIKDILLEWKNEILDRSRAALFWYAVLYIAFIVTAIISPSMAAIISMCGSFILFGFLLDGKDDVDLLWAPLTILFWTGLFVAIFCFILFIVFRFIYMNTIYKFNKWLNGEV